MKRTSVTFIRARHVAIDLELEEVHTSALDELRDFPGRPVDELTSMSTKARVMLLSKLGNARDGYADARVMETDLRNSPFLDEMPAGFFHRLCNTVANTKWRQCC